MFHAMDSFVEDCRTYQRALRQRGFDTLEKAQQYAERRATGKPFVMMGCRVVWSK